MFEPAEVFRLVMALVVVPPIIMFLRQLRSDVGRTGFLVGMSAIYASYLFTLIEAVALPELFNMLQHLCYGVAGVGVAWGAFEALRTARRGAVRT